MSIIGLRFGMLLVLGESGRDAISKLIKCKCDCGNIKLTRIKYLNRGYVKSCGCLRTKEFPVTKQREYFIYYAIKTRCYSKKSNHYHRYGGRGIIMCKRWLYSYKNFIADMGMRPSKKHSIERIDNNGNYEPSNCKWATSSEQSNNTISNNVLSFNGESLTTTQWERKTGIKRKTITRRIGMGWSIEKTLTTPV